MVNLLSPLISRKYDFGEDLAWLFCRIDSNVLKMIREDLIFCEFDFIFESPLLIYHRTSAYVLTVSFTKHIVVWPHDTGN